MPYFIFLAIFLALVCPAKKHSAHPHQSVTTMSNDSTSDSGGEDGHIHP
ncbi:hypothetical protein ACFGVR_14965 [Mucilaginibacter sp. AW1-3]